MSETILTTPKNTITNYGIQEGTDKTGDETVWGMPQFEQKSSENQTNEEYLAAVSILMDQTSFKH